MLRCPECERELSRLSDHWADSNSDCSTPRSAGKQTSMEDGKPLVSFGPLEAVREAAQTHDPLTTRNYKRWRRSEWVDAPSMYALIEHPKAPYDSWEDLLSEAGVGSTRNPWGYWTEERVKEGVSRAYNVVGDPYTSYRYSEETREDDSYPGMRQIYRVFDGWEAVKEHVGAD